MSRAIPPPPRLPTFDPWRQDVEDRLDDHDEQIRNLRSLEDCARRTEAKVDQLTEHVMVALNREAAREPLQERELGNLKTEMAKTSASSGRKWGAIAGGVVTAIAALVELLR